MTGAVDLLRDIVRIPSVSGEEEACRDALVAWLSDHGVNAWASGRNVLAVVEGRPAEDRGLLLLTHIDVVPVVEPLRLDANPSLICVEARYRTS